MQATAAAAPGYSLSMKRARGLKSLVHDAVDATVDLVALGHHSTARSVMAVLGHAGPVAEPARQVDAVRALATAGVLGTIKVVNRVVEQITDLGLDLADRGDGAPEAPLPLRSDIQGTAAWVADAAIGAANGVVGDHIARRGNGLDLVMRLRSLDGWIADQGAPADATGRIAVLVHGLATTEWSWCLDAARLHGDPAANFGTLLQRDEGYTPIFARYNTGRHVSESGAALAAALEALVAGWPVPVEELLLIGHSMGGLVVRSACHQAEEGGWVRLVRRVVTLASPLQGAPLEKFGNMAAGVLSRVDLPGTLIPARLINGRSAGIKDLRYGYVRDEEWRGRDPDAVGADHRGAVALPPHIRWCFIAATVAADPRHPASHVVGDLLVRLQSASGPADAPSDVTTRHAGGLHHAAVQVDPRVYEIVRGFVRSEGADEGAAAGAGAGLR